MYLQSENEFRWKFFIPFMPKVLVFLVFSKQLFFATFICCSLYSTKLEWNFLCRFMFAVWFRFSVFCFIHLFRFLFVIVLGHFLNCHAVLLCRVSSFAFLISHICLYPSFHFHFSFFFFIFVCCVLLDPFGFFIICIFIKIFRYYVLSLFIPTENDTD